MVNPIAVRMSLLVTLLLSWLAVTTAQVPRTLQPVDEAGSHPDFLEFRTRLQAIVERQDTGALLEILHPDIRASFGSDHGIAAFRAMWNLDAPDSELWKQLGTVLSLGGTFDGGGDFTAPYTFSRWPNDVDAFESVAVLGMNVRVRGEPQPNGPVVGSVSYALLPLDDGPPDPSAEWTAIRFDGRKAYIASRYVRSPIDYRARFTRTDGRWRMVMFLAGD